MEQNVKVVVEFRTTQPLTQLTGLSESSAFLDLREGARSFHALDARTYRLEVDGEILNGGTITDAISKVVLDVYRKVAGGVLQNRVEIKKIIVEAL